MVMLQVGYRLLLYLGFVPINIIPPMHLLASMRVEQGSLAQHMASWAVQTWLQLVAASSDLAHANSSSTPRTCEKGMQSRPTVHARLRTHARLSLPMFFVYVGPVAGRWLGHTRPEPILAHPANAHARSSSSSSSCVPLRLYIIMQRSRWPRHA
jgi:hypothetical protein